MNEPKYHGVDHAFGIDSTGLAALTGRKLKATGWLDRVAVYENRHIPRDKAFFLDGHGNLMLKGGDPAHMAGMMLHPDAVAKLSEHPTFLRDDEA